VSNRAVLYLRSSKDRSDVSIDTQRRALHELALARGLVVVDEYADAVESGKDDDRPAFQRLIAALKAQPREWEHVLVLDTSRVARRRLISMIFEGDCAKRGITLVYKSLPESDPATDMVLRSVLQAFDEYHSLISRAKGLAGMAENVRQGWRAGGRAPRGYALEYHATGAVRDGAPVLKSRLVVDDTTAPAVRAYLELRAAGVSRGQAIARTRAPWPASSTHSMDWQALTYAGHTVWGMHADRAAAADGAADKRRPRSQWQVQRNTHQALITEAQAEAILAQQERALQGRRLRDSPLLLTGLLVAPDGAAWHSDGCGFYRLGKGPKVAAARLEGVVLERLAVDLTSEAVATQLQAKVHELAAGDGPVDGRRLAGLERRIGTLTTQIGKTVDLAAQLDDPAPVLRRVRDLEHQRGQLVDELASLRARQGNVAAASTITVDQVRALLRRLFAEIADAANEKSACRAEARQALQEVLERIELDPLSPTVRLHYAVATGDMVASPRVVDQSPVLRWTAEVPLPMRRAA
jgi:site-specific DNA recombinase